MGLRCGMSFCLPLSWMCLLAVMMFGERSISHLGWPTAGCLRAAESFVVTSVGDQIVCGASREASFDACRDGRWTLFWEGWRSRVEGLGSTWCGWAETCMR